MTGSDTGAETTKSFDVGPIDYLALEFPGARLSGEGLKALIDLVDRGIIHILDLVFVTTGDDGCLRSEEHTSELQSPC